MSRASFQNERYQLAFGVDHAIGTFFIIYGPEVLGPGDRFVIATYSTQYGLQLRGGHDGTCVPYEEWKNGELKPLLKQFVGVKGNLTEEHVTGLAKALGLYSHELEIKVFQLWD